MEAGIIGKVKAGFGKKPVKLVVISLIVLLVAAVAVYLFMNFRHAPANKGTVKQQTATVRRGNLNVTVTGSGPIASSNRVDITPKVGGTITKVYFKEGDKVKAGDLMYELDDSEALLNIEKVENSIQQTQLTQDTNAQSINDLNVEAPFDGLVTNITIKQGDILGKNANMLTITDQSKLKLLVPFSGISPNDIKIGQKATVYLQAFMQSVEGTVSYVSDKAYSTASGGELYNVEIDINNPGSLKDGLKASAELSTPKGVLSSADNGTLAYINTQILKSDAGGTVQLVNVKENQHVTRGQLLVEFENNDLVVSKSTTDLKQQDLQAQLDSAKKQLTYYKVYSPIDGTIVKQTNIDPGLVVRAADVLSTVADNGHMEFNIPVDELDISKIQTGQKANITVDALEETTSKPLTGVVSKVATEGASSNGVTTYPVTVQIDQIDKLKVGMNANAEIFVEQKTNVLYLPIEAVQKMRNATFVMVPADAKTLAERRNNPNGGYGGYGNGGNRQNGGNGGNGGYSGAGNGGNSANRGNGGNAGNGGNNANRGNGGSAGNGGNNANRGNGGNGGYGGNAGNRQNGGYGGNWQGNAGNSRNNSYYSNAMMKPVQVGTNNDTYIEIVSGLNEGDQVILPQVVASSGTGNGQGGGFGGMMGGGAMRAPAGAMSGGGFRRD